MRFLNKIIEKMDQFHCIHIIMSWKNNNKKSTLTGVIKHEENEGRVLMGLFRLRQLTWILLLIAAGYLTAFMAQPVIDYTFVMLC